MRLESIITRVLALQAARSSGQIALYCEKSNEAIPSLQAGNTSTTMRQPLAFVMGVKVDVPSNSTPTSSSTTFCTPSKTKCLGSTTRNFLNKLFTGNFYIYCRNTYLIERSNMAFCMVYEQKRYASRSLGRQFGSQRLRAAALLLSTCRGLGPPGADPKPLP